MTLLSLALTLSDVSIALLSTPQASFLTLILEAQPRLASVTRIESSKADAAKREIKELLRLYVQISSGQLRPQIVSAPSRVVSLLYLAQNSAAYLMVHMLPTNIGSTSTQYHTISFTTDRQVPNAPGPTASPPTSANAACDAFEFDDTYRVSYRRRFSVIGVLEGTGNIMAQGCPVLPSLPSFIGRLEESDIPGPWGAGRKLAFRDC
jgi:hypothetical protein